MTSNACVPLGCSTTFPLDHAQSKRKTYDKRINAHRTLEVAEPWNKVSYTYNGCGSIATETYIWEKTAEVSEVITIDDVAGNLDGKSFSLYTKDGTQFRTFYTVCCGTLAPCDTPCIKYTQVCLILNDAANVIALATKLAYAANCLTVSEFSVCVVDSKITFTNLKKGNATDAVDVNTGFCISTKTPGVTQNIETLTYSYDCCGNLISVINSSNENVLGKDIVSQKLNVNITNCCMIVKQLTHDNLNANVNIQVNNTDVSACNAVPVNIYPKISDLSTLIDKEKYLQIRKDTSVVGRTIFGYASPTALQTDSTWFIFAEDGVGSLFQKQFSQVCCVPVADFVHTWSNRHCNLPAVIFLNEFSLQYFSQANHTLFVPHATNLNIQNNADLSLLVYWKSSIAGTYTLVQKASTVAGNNGYTVCLDSSGRIDFQFRGCGIGDRIRVRTDCFTSGFNGFWNSVMITKASGTTAASSVKIYVNGTNQTLNVLNDTLTGTTNNCSQLSIGSNNTGAGGRFVGNIDEVAIWTSALTVCEVAEVYNSNNGAIDLKVGSGQISDRLISWWRMGDGSFVALPTIPDEKGINHGTTGSAITAGDIEKIAPP